MVGLILELLSKLDYLFMYEGVYNYVVWGGVVVVVMDKAGNLRLVELVRIG